MDFKQIQDLIKQITKSRLSEFHLEQKDFKLIIKKNPKNKKNEESAVPTMQIVQPQVAYPAQQAQMQAVQPVNAPSPAAQEAGQSNPKAEKKEDNLITIKSPMIGTFYRRSAPDKPMLIKVGDQISPGKVVCIIEAMKLFNEVESEVSGKIVKILVEDASPVEYDQPLFLVEP